MNRTEERLLDAVSAVGDTLGPADVPALRFVRRRRLRPSWQAALVATVASVAAVIAGVSLVIGSGDSGEREPALGRAPDALTTPRTAQMVIFFCVKTSASRNCGRADAAQEHKANVQRVLNTFPEIRKFQYESREETYERLNKQLSSSPGAVHSVRPGDIPDSFRVVLRKPADYQRVAIAVIDLPGVDQVVNGNALVPPT